MLIEYVSGDMCIDVPRDREMDGRDHEGGNGSQASSSQTSAQNGTVQY